MKLWQIADAEDQQVLETERSTVKIRFKMTFKRHYRWQIVGWDDLMQREINWSEAASSKRVWWRYLAAHCLFLVCNTKWKWNMYSMGELQQMHYDSFPLLPCCSVLRSIKLRSLYSMHSFRIFIYVYLIAIHKSRRCTCIIVYCIVMASF